MLLPSMVGVFPAEPTNPAFADERVAVTGPAVGFDVVGFPPATSPTQRSVAARHTPSETTEACLDVERAPWVAGVAETVVEVAVRAATGAHGRSEGPARQTRVAEVDAGCGPRNPVDLTGPTVRRRFRGGHTGGVERGFRTSVSPSTTTVSRQQPWWSRAAAARPCPVRVSSTPTVHTRGPSR